MRLPFTSAQFFAVFQAYNAAVWPAQWLLGLAALAVLLVVLMSPERAGRIAAASLAVFWAWTAVVYHLAFFWKINPAAPWFAAIAALAAIAFTWHGAYRRGLRFRRHFGAAKLMGLAFVFYALAIYPVIGMWLGHPLSETPTFGLPCPTTLYTFGLLMMAVRPMPRMIVLMPMLWAAIGATAAFSLGVLQDYALFAALAAGVWLLVLNRARQPAGAPG